MINPHFIQDFSLFDCQKRETVLVYALVNAFREREGNTEFSFMETSETSIDSKNVLKGVQTHIQLEH